MMEEARQAKSDMALAVRMTIDGKNSDTRKNHMERLVAEGYRVTSDKKGRKLVSPRGSFFRTSDITKSAMDYAEKLCGLESLYDSCAHSIEGTDTVRACLKCGKTWR